MTDLNLTIRPTSDGAVIALVGDLDYDSAATLRAAVATITLRPGQVLTLDLAALTFCDSSGITALVTAHHHAQTREAEMILANIPAHTDRVLRFVGLDQILGIRPITTPAPEPPA
ncbi:MAG TPA: STAS domain-containing protein [Actinocrinis sp.]|nr:STAS domain-containing protein [Actinocrinis sp.]